MTTRTYRSKEQWQSIMDDFQTSGLSGAQYCSQNNLPYASFAKWRTRLSSNCQSVEPAGSSASSFLDLSGLSSRNPGGDHWNITLKLGNGVELVLSQG